MQIIFMGTPKAIRVAGFVFFLLGCITMGNAADAPAPTFNKEVAPILLKHCANCHRPGEIGAPISLVSYDAARPWAQAIKQQVVGHEMPPWPTDPNHSMKFRNDPRLTQQEIDTLVAWVDAGSPKGKDANLPPLPDFPQGWLHPKGIAPDLVIPLREFHLPATGEIPYVRYLAKVPFLDDKWIVALQVRPGNRAVVHHMAITELALDKGVAPDDLDHLAQVARELGLPSASIGTQPAVVDPVNPVEYDMLGVYTPGTTFEMYRDGTAKLLKGGENMYLNFNIHYQTTGRPEVDQSRLALWFQPNPPEHQVYRVPASGGTIIADGKELLTDSPGQKAEGTMVAIPPIPPNTDNYEVIGITAYTEPVTIYQLQPHAHLRGKDFKYAVVYPDGREETLLTVPKYNFHWQLAYELEDPLKLPAGSKLVVTAHYDNSSNNEHLMHHHQPGDSANNPGPEKEVYFREANQSWDEMFTPFIQYSIDTEDPARPKAAKPGRSTLPLVEVVGCLEKTSAGTWMLGHAGEAAAAETQTTSAAAVKAAAAKPLGDERDQLIGVEMFNPQGHKGQKTVAKGVLIEDGKQNRLNVTSLQMLATNCF